MPRTKQFDEKEVLENAMELFWEKGFHATSIQDLVSHLGINRASLYDTYGGKDELFNTAFETYRQQAGNFLKSVFEKEPSVKEGFRSLFYQAVDEGVLDCSRKGCFVVNTTTEMVPGDETLQKVIEGHVKKISQVFADQIQRGIDNGELSSSKNPEEIGMMLLTFYNGLRVIGKVSTDADSLKNMVETTLSVLD
ncbi:MAG: TetR/AcrR family transcriptional regulator [Bacteroidota bacterium]